MENSILWEKILVKLSKNSSIDEEIFNKYIRNSYLYEFSSDEYTIVLGSSFGLKTITDNIKELVNNSFKEELGQMVIINYTDKKEFKTIINVLEKQQESQPKQIKKKNSLDLTFENFISGASNEKAFLAAKLITQTWNVSINPLFIYGESGLGKTHLLKAIENEMINKNQKKIIYISSEEFGDKVVEVVRQGTQEIDDFKNSLKIADCLIMDDVQFLANKTKTNEILFSIFNYFIENNKQLVFSSDKSPESLNGFDNRLITRFNMGLTTKIELLDYDTSLAIIENEIQNELPLINITRAVKEYIAGHIADDVRKIKGILNKFNFLFLGGFIEGEIDFERANEILKDTPSSNLGELNVKRIKEVVAESFGVPLKNIDGKVRIAKVVAARHLAMYLTKDILSHKYVQIGVEFGGRDHSSVMSGIKKIEKKNNEDADFAKVVSQLKKKILSK